MNDKINILLAEDDKNLGIILHSFLSKNNFCVQWCRDGIDAIEKYRKKDFDILLIDIMMPNLDGFAMAKIIRKNDERTPIIFLTAKNSQHDIQQGFELGADDYVVKPFNMDELISRINAIYRRVHNNVTKQNIFCLSSYTFDSVRHVIIRNGVETKLTSRELDLLYILCEHKNQVVERSLILDKIWHQCNVFNARNMDVYIAKLRKIFHGDSNIEIVNVHGVGYKLIVKD